jgi:two-component system, NarL family, vancomycin resistance associated response regulator VraR
VVEGPSSPIKVLLCEDSLGFRMLASAWLDDADDMELVGVAETGGEAVDLAGRLQPEVVLLDHLLPDADSSTLVVRLRDAAPGVAIALVSGMPNDLLAAEAGRAGVEAYCSKASEPSGFLAIVREARAVANS